MNLASPTLDKSSYPLSEMGYQYFLEFHEVKENMLPCLESYDLLNDLLKSVFEKTNLKIENHIKKTFEEEKTDLTSTSKIEKIKIIYILSQGHFNILTNRKNRTITIDFFLAFNNQNNKENIEINKHEMHSVCKNLEISLCDLFGWENCFLNLYFKRGGNSNSLKLPENKASQANILKNVKLLARKQINGSEYRIYDSLVLEKIFIKNEQLLFSSKLFNLIASFFYDFKCNKVDSFNLFNDKFIAFTEYFPKLNFLLFNYQNLSNVLKSLEKKDQATVLLVVGGDYMYALLLMLLVLRERSLVESQLRQPVKILFEEKDKNKINLLRDNIINFGDFMNEIKNEGLFEIIESINNKENKWDLVVNLEEERKLEENIEEYYKPIDQAAPFITFVKNSEREKSEEILKNHGFNKFDFTNINEEDDIFDDMIVIAYKLEQ